MKKLLTIIALALTLTACGGSENKIEPKTVSVTNGSGTEIIAHQSVIYVPEAEITEEYIQQWYEAIKNKDTNHDVIIAKEYKDYRQAPGIFHSGHNITKHQKLDLQDDGSYMMGDTGEEIFTIQDGQLVKP